MGEWRIEDEGGGTLAEDACQRVPGRSSKLWVPV